MIGIDSGPLHVAGATTTPTLGVWTQHHPIHFYDLADNVVHLVPHDHFRLASGPAAVAYFDEHYRHRIYKTVRRGLLAELEVALHNEPSLPKT